MTTRANGHGYGLRGNKKQECTRGRGSVGRKLREANTISLGHDDFEISEGDLCDIVSK